MVNINKLQVKHVLQHWHQFVQ